MKVKKGREGKAESRCIRKMLIKKSRTPKRERV